jgi:hypothetical protein
MTTNRSPINRARSDQANHRELFGILPPLAVVVAVLLVLLFRPRQGGDFFSLAFLLCSAAIPHFAALIVLFRGAPRRRALIAGFLCGFWGSCVAYLLFHWNLPVQPGIPSPTPGNRVVGRRRDRNLDGVRKSVLCEVGQVFVRHRLHDRHFLPLCGDSRPRLDAAGAFVRSC